MFVSRVGPPAMSDRVGPCLLILHLAAMLAENVGRDNGAEGVLRVMPTCESSTAIEEVRLQVAWPRHSCSHTQQTRASFGAPAWRKRDDGQIGHSQEAA